jgi:hypothetical protein
MEFTSRCIRCCKCIPRFSHSFLIVDRQLQYQRGSKSIVSHVSGQLAAGAIAIGTLAPVNAQCYYPSPPLPATRNTVIERGMDVRRIGPFRVAFVSRTKVLLVEDGAHGMAAHRTTRSRAGFASPIEETVLTVDHPAGLL